MIYSTPDRGLPFLLENRVARPFSVLRVSPPSYKSRFLIDSLYPSSFQTGYRFYRNTRVRGTDEDRPTQQGEGRTLECIIRSLFLPHFDIWKLNDDPQRTGIV